MNGEIRTDRRKPQKRHPNQFGFDAFWFHFFGRSTRSTDSSVRFTYGNASVSISEVVGVTIWTLDSEMLTTSVWTYNKRLREDKVEENQYIGEVQEVMGRSSKKKTKLKGCQGNFLGIKKETLGTKILDTNRCWQNISVPLTPPNDQPAWSHIGPAVTMTATVVIATSMNRCSHLETMKPRTTKNSVNNNQNKQKAAAQGQWMDDARRMNVYVHTMVEPPLPISNREVKHHLAELVLR